MTRADGTSADRKRGSVRVRGASLQMRVFAGVDPVTGRDRYLSESVKGTDRAARRQAEKALARLQAEVDGQRSAQSNVTLGYTLDEWLRTVEFEDSTRDTYVGYIERTIRPTLGSVPISKLSTRTLESFYAELRRCRKRCNGRHLRLPAEKVTLRRRTGRPDAGWHLKLPSGVDRREEVQLPLARARGATAAPVARLRTHRRAWKSRDDGRVLIAELVVDEVTRHCTTWRSP